MRAAWLGVLLFCAGCDAGTRACRAGTLFIHFSSDSGVDADSLGIDVTIGNGAAKHGSYAFPSGGAGSIEVDFGSYPQGQSVTVSLTAIRNNLTVAKAAATLTLPPGCTTATLQLTAVGVDMDLSVGDGNFDLTMPPDLTPHPVAVIQSTPDLVGFVTRLDGSGSSDPLGRALTYGWRFISVPVGSAISAAALMPSASAITPSFDPDLGGTYTVELTVSAPDGTQGVTTADVVVPTIPIFYVEGKVNGDLGQSAAMGVVRSDGSGRRTMSCNLLPDAGFSGTATDFVGQTQQIGMLRSFYPTGGTPTVVYLQFFVDDMMNATAKLFRADETTDCAAKPPVQIDSSDATAANHIHAWPRLSPDGKRVVYLDESTDQNNPANPIRVITVGLDGSSLRRVRSSEKVSSVPAIWTDNTHLAWVESDPNDGHPIIVKASDANFAGDSNVAPADRTLVIECTSADGPDQLTVINQIALGGGGFVVSAGYRARKPLFGNTFGSLNLYRMIDSCAVGMRTVLVEEPATGESFDFDVSPDGLTVVFSSTHGEPVQEDGGATPLHDIFVLPTDGSGTPRKLAGSPVFEDVGPVFVAGGRQILWTQYNGTNADQGPSGGGLMLIDDDGTHQRSLYGNSHDADNAVLVSSGGNAGFTCDWVAGTAPTGAAVLVVFFVLLLLRRKTG
jgi:WD40-like Beta Propeller Repeat